MPTWEIYTYGNGEFLSMIFNGVVALIGDGNFTTLMRLAGVFGLFWVSIKAALYRGPVEWTYLIWFVLIYAVLFVPKVDVVIVDRLDNNQTRVVANVPWGLGTFAGATAKIGDWFTRGTEAVMSLPGDLKYQRNGVVFGASLVEAASQYAITDGRFTGNMSEFMRQCVFYDVFLRRYTWTDLLEADDTWDFVRANTSPASRSIAYTFEDGTQSIMPCQAAANTVLSADWQAEVQRAARLYGKRQYKDTVSNMTNAAAKLMTDLPVSYDYLAGISKSGADTIRANMMANLFRRSFGSAAAAADAGAAAQDFALAQAEVQQRSTYAVMGKLAAKFLPLLKNIYEGLLYGMFSFLFLVFMLPIGVKVFLAYLKNIVWLQLWAPLYAILNLLMMLHAKSAATAAAAQLGGQALSLATHSGLAAVNADTAIIAGYMGLSIPLIAYGLVSGGQMALTQLASQVAAVAQSAAQQAGASAATGNINLANLGMYNTGMFKHDTNAAMNYGQGQWNDGHGATHTLSRNGGVHAIGNLRSDVGVAADMGETLQFAKRQSLAEVDQATRSAARTYSDGLATSLGQGMDLTRHGGIDRKFGDGWTEQHSGAWKDYTQKVEELAQKIDKETGIGIEQAKRIVYQASADIQAGVSGRIHLAGGSNDGPGASATGGIVAKAGVKGEAAETEKYSEAYKLAQSGLDKESVGNAVEALKQYATRGSYETGESAGAKLGAGLRSRLEDTLQHEQRWQAAREHQTKAQQEWSTVDTNDQTVRASLVDEFISDLQRSGYAWQELLADPARARERADAITRWAGMKFGGALEGPAAAAKAAEFAMNPGVGQMGSTFGMGQRRETAIKAAGGEQAVDQAHRQDQGTVPGERSVSRQAGRNDSEVVDRPLSPDSPYGGARTLLPQVATDQDKLGRDAPLTHREDVENFKNTVNVKADPDGEAVREVAEKGGQLQGKQHLELSDVPEKGGQLQGKQHLELSDVPDKIEEGKEKTDVSKAWYAKLNPFQDEKN